MEFRCRYPKDKVYPASGGEFSLEMLRASFPQYKPLPEDDSCDMELTVACAGDISVMVPSHGTKSVHEDSLRYSVPGSEAKQFHQKDQSSHAQSGGLFARSATSSIAMEQDQVARETTQNVVPANHDRAQNEWRRQLYQYDERPCEGGMEKERNARAGCEGGRGSRRDGRENVFMIRGQDDKRIGNYQSHHTRIGNREDEDTGIGNRKRMIGNQDNERMQIGNQGNEQIRIGNQENSRARSGNQENEHSRIRNRENDARIGYRENERVKTVNQGSEYMKMGNRESEWQGKSGAEIKEQLFSHQGIGQDNSHVGQSKSQTFGFTPMSGSSQYPSAHMGRVNTKLNFSELESSVLSVSSDQLCASDSHKPMAGFDVSSDLEAKAMMLMEAKQSSENEFMMTEFELPKKPSQQLTSKKILGVLEGDVSNHPATLFPDSQSSVYDSMAAADESSFLCFQDESCMSFRKASEVKSSRSLGGNIGSREDSMASRSYGGKVTSSAAISKPIGGVAQQPALGSRKDISASSDPPPPQPRSGYNVAQDSYSIYDSMTAADESSYLPFQDESCVSFRKASEVKSSRSLGGNIGSREDSIASRSYSGKVTSSSAVLSKQISSEVRAKSQRVLQELPVMSSDRPLQHRRPEYDTRQTSYRPYNSTTLDESTFVPYCYASNASVAPPPAPPPSSASIAPGGPNFPRGATGGISVQPSNEFLEITQGFTQFDIKHPVSYDPSSTPAHHQKSLNNMSINLSIISGDGKETTSSGDSHYCTQPLVVKPTCLSTITEESSGKSKLTVSSNRSRNTTIATSSSSTSLGNGTDCDLSAMVVDPFLPETVNRMLNRLGGVPADIVEEMAPEESFSITEGDCLRLGGTGVVYDRVAIIRGNGGGGGINDPRSVVYRCTGDKDQDNIMQVLIYGGEWAVTAAHHCQDRLVKMKNLSHMAEAFPRYEQVCLYKNPTNVAVTVTRNHRFGSLMDFQEHAYQRKIISLPDLFVTYVCASMLNAVSTFHKVGFLHTQISPRHFLIHDISSQREQDALLELMDHLLASGFSSSTHSLKMQTLYLLTDPKFMKLPCAVRLIDFKYCVDTSQFGEDRLFVGCPMTDMDPSAAWLCPLMKEGKPWKWQVDYYGLAMSMLSFMNYGNKEPRLLLDRQTGRYAAPELPARFNNSLWHNVFDQLLNTEGWVDLDQLKTHLLTTINTFKMNVIVTFLAKKLQ